MRYAPPGTPWVLNEDIEGQSAAPGVTRKILAYNQDMMSVENHFETGAIGSLHSHPHTQITYVVSGEFEFEIAGEKRRVRAGDTMLKRDGVLHGCVCIQEGILLDLFTPVREDFLK